MARESVQSSLLRGTRDWELRSGAIARILQAVIGVTTSAACWRPARQATDVDPVMLLREE
jgi:hypothetical protein